MVHENERKGFKSAEIEYKQREQYSCMLLSFVCRASNGMSFQYSKKWMICPALVLPLLCLHSKSYTFDNSSTILVVSREPDNFTHISDSLPELCNCTYATASSCCCSFQNESTNMEEYLFCSSLTDAFDEVLEMANIKWTRYLRPFI